MQVKISPIHGASIPLSMWNESISLIHLIQQNPNQKRKNTFESFWVLGFYHKFLNSNQYKFTEFLNTLQKTKNILQHCNKDVYLILDNVCYLKTSQ